MNGFDAGKADGEMGKKTVAAIKAFQKSVGQEPSGQINDALVKELLKRNKKS
jgi:localization factor PodJL